MKTILLDNYDSFTFNLYQYVGEIDEPPLVFRNDRVTIEELRRLKPDRIIISPGPGRPDDPDYFGVCLSTILELGPSIPTLGVCLGHQGIIHAFGGRVVRAAEVMHGKTSFVFHNQSNLFSKIPRAFEAMRYHSLVGDLNSLPHDLKVTAKTWDDVIMAVEHVEYPIYGLQFHPESVGTTSGKQLLENFLFFGAESGGTESTAVLAKVSAGLPATRRTTVHEKVQIVRQRNRIVLPRKAGYHG